MAVHFVDKKSNILELASGEQNLQQLNPAVIEFILKLITEVWNAHESGNVNSGFFSSTKSQAAKNSIENIKNSHDDFFSETVTLARRLYASTPNTASSGLLAIVRCLSYDSDAHVALLKIQKENESFVRLRENELTQITVEDIKNLLQDKIQKGAIIPHPNKRNYDLKTIDKQGEKGVQAKYFTEGFLGCVTKKSDEHQIKSLIPTIKKFGTKKNLSIVNSKIPELMCNLDKQNKNVTTPTLERVIRETGIFKEEFNRNEFITHIDEESRIGKLDIPHQLLTKKKTTDRKMKITFNHPKYRNVEIRGPFKVLQELMETEGDSIKITIEGTEDIFKFEMM